jgi:DnaJ-domain-containing protein 1
MTGSIFDIERMYREKDAQFLKWKLEKFVSDNRRSFSESKLKAFLSDSTVVMLKKNLSLNDMDLAEEIQFILNRFERESNENFSKVIPCDYCNTRLRISSPITKGIYSCPTCDSEFKVFPFGTDIYTVFLDPNKDKNAPKKNEVSDFDPYLVLGLSYNSNLEEIKTAYRKKIATCHPDKVSEMAPEIRHLAEEMAKKINLAYNRLLQKMAPDLRKPI